VLGDGHEYHHAYNGVDALMIAVDMLPNLVILDVSMPLLDGRTVCAKLKGYPMTAGLKVVMVSGRSEQFDRRLGFEVGADDYVDKPARASDLVAAIGRVLSV
jgi:DNA-binding response OmpR family regulator